ncbi:MAG: hypothetical protein AABZ65_07445 [Candidatus Omnitrophota bacterium]
MNKKKQTFLDLGYKAAIILSFLGIIGSAAYLFFFLAMSPLDKMTGEITSVSLTAERRLSLLSTGIFVAMSFGFLGFALFLIQAKGDVDIEFEKPANESGSSYKLKLARLSPGLFVILCATVIIIVCVTFRIEYKVSETKHADQSMKDKGFGEIPDVSVDDLGLPTSKESDNK